MEKQQNTTTNNNNPNSSPNVNTNEFPWHAKTWQQYLAARNVNHLPHAVLLSGEEGIGKLSLAKRLAKSLLCLNTVTQVSDACGQCQSCKTYESGANPDFTEIALLEDKKHIGVDQIRALSEFLNYSRSYNTYRVVIINPVERMNINAANSLLKSLEEPSSNTVIILVTAKISDLLATIKSRCQLFNVASPTKIETIQWIQHQQAIDESDQTDSTQIDPNILYEVLGSKPLYAYKITQKDIDNKKLFLTNLRDVIKEEMSLTEMAKKWEEHDIESLLDWQIIHLQKCIKSSFTSSYDDNSKASSPLIRHLSSEQQWLLYQSLIKQKQYIHTSVNSLMFIENMIMLWMKAA